MNPSIEQISTMKLAIDQNMEWTGVDGSAKRSEVARLVFDIAAETTEFDSTALAETERARLLHDQSSFGSRLTTLFAGTFTVGRTVELCTVFPSQVRRLSSLNQNRSG
jgi:hypothetical protein